MEPIALRWSKRERLPLSIPTAWRVVAQSDVRPPDPIQDLPAAIRSGLEDPIGSPPLSDLVGPDATIALVMDDPGRPTPIRRLAPVVLDRLLEAGAQRENITGLFALGAHRVMTSEEMTARAGTAVTSRIPCYSFDCRDPSAFAHLGRTRRGTPVHINRIAAQADLRILLGTIEPHPQAGFGGGLKNLLPGLAGAATIGRNHLLTPSAEEYNMIGTLPEENPMRLDLEEAGSMLEGRTFIVNLILDLQLNPVGLFCGNPIMAHRAGVAVARQIYGVEIPDQVDVVITSAYPMEQELRQAGKSLLNVAGACRPGGVLVGFMRCQKGLGGVTLPRLPLPLPLARRLARAMGSRRMAALARHAPGLAPEARFMVNFGLQMLKDFHVLIFSPRLKQVCQKRFPPVLYGDQAELFHQVHQLVASDAPEVAIFHEGGISFPIVLK